ncbi:MAG: SRPBCC family protein [Actinobacteria bacterium]|nr:SRPBCC family protein [Actinomycetota bacterium]
MIRIERDVRVGRPRPEVFAYLTDPERIPEWQATAVEVVREHEGDLAVGMRWKETRVFMGKRIEQTVETTKYEPVEEFALAVVDGPIPLRIHHRLADDGGATVISVTGEGEPGGMFRFGARLIVPVVERQFDEDFARLRAIVESA